MAIAGRSVGDGGGDAAGGQNEDGEGPESTTMSSSATADTATATDEGGSNTDSTASDTEPTTETTRSGSDLTLGEASLVTVDRGYSEEVGGEVTITNEGNAPTGRFTVGLDWIDDNGEYMATTDIYGRALTGGESWSARALAYLDVEEPRNIDGVEASLTEEDNSSFEPPDDVEVTDENFLSSEEEVTVRGTIVNNRSASEFIEVVGMVYDSDGTIIGMRHTIEEVSGGDSWRIDMSPDTYGRNGEADSGTLYPYID
jgi:hypothetical protein